MIPPRPWEDLERDIMHCTRCDLCRTRTRAVPGQGARQSDLMFVGEGPGADEDLQGQAFVGRAGRLLTELLTSADISRESVYITNVVKCRPPGNRLPSDHEIERCLPYLRRQVSLLRPQIICTLGNTALKSLINARASISREHGQFLTKGRFLFFPTYHPAAALRQDSLVPLMKRDFNLLATKWRSLHGDHDQSSKETLDRATGSPR